MSAVISDGSAERFDARTLEECGRGYQQLYAYALSSRFQHPAELIDD